ncbi:MAG: threonine dehydratase [Candidatus Binatota bacterium]|nr:threonine dehydratase [Candidatus Binatota bacterium]
MKVPTYDDVVRARSVIAPHLPRTPTLSHPGLSRLLGCDLRVKHENHLPTGAFKVRGGVNLLATLSEEEKARGLVTATRGNHGLSIAWAARLFGVRAVIVVPHGNNPEKNEGMLALGAELVVHGRDFDEARAHVAERVAAEGLREVHPANEPALIAGVGTGALEIFEDVEAVDVLVVPIGLGSGISGACLVRERVSPTTIVIGVQAERAPAVYRSWKEKRTVTTDSADTIADGLATRMPAELTLSMIDRMVDRIVTVSEEEILEAMARYLRHTHNLAEGAAAAGLAAAFRLRDELRGRRVVVVLSGSNVDAATLRRVLAEVPRRVSLTIYGRADCELCDEMKAEITEATAGVPHDLAEVDVATDPRLERRFGLDVPVLFLEGHEIARHRISARELRGLLRSRA